jgi:hypothetical protein
MNIAIIIDACDSHEAEDDLIKDGRVLLMSTTKTVSWAGFCRHVSAGLDHFGDYIDEEVGDENGVSSLKEVDKIATYLDYTEDHVYKSWYPTIDADPKDELHITFQNWEDGRFDQFVKHPFKSPQLWRVNTYYKGTQILYSNSVAQTFTPNVETLTRIRIRMNRYPNWPSEKKIYASIHYPEYNEYGEIIGPGTLVPNAETYVEPGDIEDFAKYITFDFEPYDVEVTVGNTYFFVLQTKEPELLEANRYVISVRDIDIYNGEDYCAWKLNEYENPNWEKYSTCDVLFATYGLNENENNPPYVPKRPSGPHKVKPSIWYKYYVWTEDVEGHEIYFSIDWGDDTTTPRLERSTPSETFGFHEWEWNGENERFFVKVQAMDDPDGNPETPDGISSDDSDVLLVELFLNEPPEPPDIDGPTSGKTGETLEYTFMTTDSHSDDVSYFIRWGDGEETDWTTFQDSGPPGYIESHSWDTQGTYIIQAKAKDIDEAESDWAYYEVNIVVNNPPTPPDITGETYGKSGQSYDYYFVSTDPDDGDYIASYTIDWGDTNEEVVYGPFESGVPIMKSHTWVNTGYYTIKAKAEDEHGAESDWGELEVEMPRYINQGCPHGTQVTMAPGSPETTLPIEAIRVGDLISSYNPDTQQVTIAEVVEVCEYPNCPSDKFIFNGILTVTTEHTIFIDGFEWLEAYETILYDLMSENIPGTPFINQVPIFSKLPSALGGTIYDLVIEPLEGNASGYWANGILVGGYD